MALIKCPECGKNNVSSSAEICPDCGYPIKDYISNQQNHNETKVLSNNKSTPINIKNDSTCSKNNIYTIRCKSCGALYPNDMTKCPSCSQPSNTTKFVEKKEVSRKKTQYRLKTYEYIPTEEEEKITTILSANENKKKGNGFLDFRRYYCTTWFDILRFRK